MNDLEIVVATQEYIKTHHNDVDFSIENICKAIGYSRRQLDRLFRNYNFERYGYKVANNIAPFFNFGAQTEIGARIAVPVTK